MIMTLAQYISNPQGKGSSATHIRQWKSEHDPRYQLLIDTHGNFEVFVYKTPTGQYFVHVKVPSETYDEVVYDAVFKLDSKGIAASNLTSHWGVRAITNSPSFVFTYENVFKRNKILVEELKSLLPDEAYNEPPVIRNPYKVVGYEKTLYYAARFLVSHYPSIANLDSISVKYNLKDLQREFMSYDKIKHRSDAARARRVEENRKERKKLKKQKPLRNERTTGDKILRGDKQENSSATKVDRTVNRIKPVVSTKRITPIQPIKKRR